ncbi:MAG: PIN domain-containing protein [Candidatus Helarchaeota archaeon]
MKLVIDSNCLFAAFIKDSVSRLILLSNKFEFYAPFEILEEFKKYEEYLIKKSNLSPNLFDNLYFILLEQIYFVSLKEYEEEFERAMKIMQDFDIKDAPFLAIGLALDLDGIWSDDKHFMKQNEVKTYSTNDLLSMLKENSL